MQGPNWHHLVKKRDVHDVGPTSVKKRGMFGLLGTAKISHNRHSGVFFQAVKDVFLGIENAKFGLCCRVCPIWAILSQLHALSAYFLHTQIVRWCIEIDKYKACGFVINSSAWRKSGACQHHPMSPWKPGGTLRTRDCTKLGWWLTWKINNYFSKSAMNCYFPLKNDR